MDPEQLMRQAINAAIEGMRLGQSPFGCAIALDGRVIACRHNTVLSTPDITAHAEINALRCACESTKLVHLMGATVATTCEPCPMCMSALHWAQVETVYFGATIADAAAAGFNELQLPAHELLQRGGSEVQLVGNVLRKECQALFEQWLELPKHQSY